MFIYVRGGGGCDVEAAKLTSMPLRVSAVVVRIGSVALLAIEMAALVSSPVRGRTGLSTHPLRPWWCGAGGSVNSNGPGSHAPEDRRDCQAAATSLEIQERPSRTAGVAVERAHTWVEGKAPGEWP